MSRAASSLKARAPPSTRWGRRPQTRVSELHGFFTSLLGSANEEVRCASAAGPGRAQSGSASALVNYVLGVAGQNAAKARLHLGGTDRSAFLASVAARWARLDPAQHLSVRQVARQLREHDDRAQSVAGIETVRQRLTHPDRDGAIRRCMPKRPSASVQNPSATHPACRASCRKPSLVCL